MKIVNLIIMNPSNAGNGNVGIGSGIPERDQLWDDIKSRAGLANFDKNAVSTLKVKIFGNESIIYPPKENYFNQGRITDESIEKWLKKNKWTSSEHKFLFEVTYDTVTQELVYEYVGIITENAGLPV